MQLSIELVLVATVAVISAGIVIFLVQGEANSFGNLIESQSTGAKCDLWKTQYRNSYSCPEDTSGDSQLEQKLRNQCNVPNPTCSCTNSGLSCSLESSSSQASNPGTQGNTPGGANPN